MTTKDLKEGALRGATTAGVAFGVITLLSPASGNYNVNLAGLNFPLKLAFPVAMGAGSLLSSYTHDFILKHIPYNERYATLESAAINAGVAAGSATGLLYLSNPNLFDGGSALKMAGLGIASEIGGNYIYDNFVKQITDLTF